MVNGQNETSDTLYSYERRMRWPLIPADLGPSHRPSRVRANQAIVLYRSVAQYFYRGGNQPEVTSRRLAEVPWRSTATTASTGHISF